MATWWRATDGKLSKQFHKQSSNSAILVIWRTSSTDISAVCKICTVDKTKLFTLTERSTFLWMICRNKGVWRGIAFGIGIFPIFLKVNQSFTFLDTGAIYVKKNYLICPRPEILCGGWEKGHYITLTLVTQLWGAHDTVWRIKLGTTRKFTTPSTTITKHLTMLQTVTCLKPPTSCAVV